LADEKKQVPNQKESEVKKAVKGLVYGMAMHGMVTYALKTRMYLENLFMLITMGDMLGVPILPPYYSLRLLPYSVPHVKTLIINPSHALEAGASHRTDEERAAHLGKRWLEPSDLLKEIPRITGGYYYGIGHEGELEQVVLTEAFGLISR
jgi:hypothetical protein